MPLSWNLHPSALRGIYCVGSWTFQSEWVKLTKMMGDLEWALNFVRCEAFCVCVPTHTLLFQHHYDVILWWCFCPNTCSFAASVLAVMLCHGTVVRCYCRRSGDVTLHVSPKDLKNQFLRDLDDAEVIWLKERESKSRRSGKREWGEWAFHSTFKSVKGKERFLYFVVNNLLWRPVFNKVILVRRDLLTSTDLFFFFFFF